MEQQDPVTEGQNEFDEDKRVAIPKPGIYSRMAVTIFGALFSNVFGGFMLLSNLKRLGQPRAGIEALVASIVSTFIIIVLLLSFPERSGWLSPLANIGGAALLSSYFFTKYIPEEKELPRRSLAVPMIASIILVAVLFAFLYFEGAFSSANL